MHHLIANRILPFTPAPTHTRSPSNLHRPPRTKPQTKIRATEKLSTCSRAKLKLRPCRKGPKAKINKSTSQVPPHLNRSHGRKRRQVQSVPPLDCIVCAQFSFAIADRHRPSAELMLKALVFGRFEIVVAAAAAAALAGDDFVCEGVAPVSYTHLTLPTIYSV